ncbi:MAG TPA: class I SAM-dependent methyltransferase [Fimbriimonadaceae bacterium]|nr:class I SAM-dependent methyltransferase [Fimbriimonadaceae bacterium]
MNETWSAYYDATTDKPLHPLLISLEPYLPKSGLAVDLGCGVGIGTKFLLEHGLQVIAVDAEAEAFDRMGDLACTRVCSSFSDFKFPACDVVVAQFSLFFLSDGEFREFWPRLTQALKPGGLFCGQLLGRNDDWVSRGYSAYTDSEVRQFLEAFDILSYEEADRDGQTSLGESKHWHVFHIIARKLG